MRLASAPVSRSAVIGSPKTLNVPVTTCSSADYALLGLFGTYLRPLSPLKKLYALSLSLDVNEVGGCNRLLDMLQFKALINGTCATVFCCIVYVPSGGPQIVNFDAILLFAEDDGCWL